jgi:hypothetical protein
MEKVQYGMSANFEAKNERDRKQRPGKKCKKEEKTQSQEPIKPQRQVATRKRLKKHTKYNY